jgi:hypothetical protein
MDDITRTVISVAAGYALKWLEVKFLEPKVSLVWWPVHTSGFNYAATATAPAGTFTTHAFTVWNNGRKGTEGLEVAHAWRPQLFALWPARHYTEKTTPQGQHVIEIANLGPGESFTVSIAAGGPNPMFPQLLYIRSKEGHAQQIPMVPQRVWPRWYGWLVGVVFFVGAGTLLWGLIWAIQRGLHAVGR